MSVKNTTNKEQSEILIENVKIEKTPFTLVKHKELGTKIAIGNDALTHWIDEESAMKLITGTNGGSSINWEFITSVICCLSDRSAKIREQIKLIEENERK